MALDSALTAYPVPRPTPRPDPAATPVAPAAPAAPAAAPQPQNLSLAQAQQGAESANSAAAAGYKKAADATREQGKAEAAFQGQQTSTIEGLHSREEQELRGLDQGPFQPTHDTLAGMGALFMMVGMMGAFMGGKGTASAAANAQAALTGIIGGWNKGEEAEIAHQKQVFDENANYLKDKASSIKDIYKNLYEDAKSGNLPGALSEAKQKLINAGADVNASVLESKGLEAGAKNAETILRTVETLEAKKAQLDEMHWYRAQELALKRDAQKQFTPEMSELMGALAEKGVSLPVGLRSLKQQTALYQGLLARHPGMAPDAIADLIKAGKIDLAAEMKETQIAAGIAGRVGVAAEEIGPMGDLVISTAAKVPRKSFLPVNKLLAMGEEQLQDPNLRTLKVQINALLSAYDILAARGGTDKDKRAAAHKLLTDADSPEYLAAGVNGFKQEVNIAQKAADRAIHTYGGSHGGNSDAAPRKKVGDTIYQDGRPFKVTKVDQNGRVLEAN